MNLLRRTVLLVQLPIPPLGPAPIRGNVPLAAAYLKLFAEQQGPGQLLRHRHPARRAGQHARRPRPGRGPRRARAVAGRLHLLPLEHRAHPLDRPRAEAPPAGTCASSWAARKSRPTTPGCWTRPITTSPSSAKANRPSPSCCSALLDDETPPVPIAGLYVPPPARDRASGPTAPRPSARRCRI